MDSGPGTGVLRPIPRKSKGATQGLRLFSLYISVIASERGVHRQLPELHIRPRFRVHPKLSKVPVQPGWDGGFWRVTTIHRGKSLLFLRNILRNSQTSFRALQCVFGSRVVNLHIVALEALLGSVSGFLRALNVDFLWTLRYLR